MISLIGMAVFSGFSLNLLLQFALGAKGATGENFRKTDVRRELPLMQMGILFLSSFVLWVFFNYLVPDYWKGFSVFFLFFPLSALACMGLELLAEHIFPQLFPPSSEKKRTFSAFTAYEGLVPASLMITSLVAGNFGNAFTLTLFFAIGNLTAMLILNEIRRRSNLEWIPRYLRGSPLILISMGLLSLISVSVAGICFKILEFF
jgi:electron transport complex protein RnfA